MRWLAAQKLAQDGATETTPAILEALSLEKTSSARVNIAFALAQLGETKGLGTLLEACHDDTTRPYLRAVAARYVLDLHRDDKRCLNDLVDMLRVDSGPDSRLEAISLLPRFRGLSKEESQEVLQGLFVALKSSQPAVRLASSHALGEIGNSSALPYLRNALASEGDTNVRSEMQADIRRLEQAN